MNMVFELGLYMGMKSVKGKEGKFLVLTEKGYAHQKLLSDILVIDTHRAHGGDYNRAIDVVYKWLRKYVLSGPTQGKTVLKIPSIQQCFRSYLKQRDDHEKQTHCPPNYCERQTIMRVHIPNVDSVQLVERSAVRKRSSAKRKK
jgi:hypothetical protein